ncbi:helix-turn-helix domain-containing protein [Oleidesulfovibrio sp.]|uniref:helix-turn-helix domain-containing protein n=1 Tax=Oleidesulfovibrio sp. TaxID=2909707 RepID=UPI003A884AAC
MKKTTFTVSEAAELLSCHKETIRRAIKDGSLQAAQLGRGYRISRADLEAFWTSKGGGSLFEQDSHPTAESVPQPEVQKEKPKKPKGPEQLTLPTS